MTPAQALSFAERHGIVLEAARHATVADLAETIAGEAIRGSGWSHPRSRELFTITCRARRVRCARVPPGRRQDQFVHARCWPALIKLSTRLPGASLARIREVHSESGRHCVEQPPFPQWVPPDTAAAARHLTQADAIATLGALSFLFERTS